MLQAPGALGKPLLEGFFDFCGGHMKPERKEKKEKLINLRVTEHERRRMAEIAKRHGMTLSAFIRALVLENQEAHNENGNGNQ
jgi:predicted HicB family RNase H-like nuclease